MRTHHVLLILLFGATTQVAAQGRWQLRAGVGQMRCNDPIGMDHGSHTGRKVYGMGGHFGAGYECMFSHSMGWRAEMMVNMRRCGYDIAAADLPYRSPNTGVLFANGRRTLRMTQIEVPVALAIRKWSLLRVDAGLSTAYLLAAQDRIVGSADGLAEQDVADRTATMPRMEFALLVGAEVESGRHLGMCVRYKHGITDLDRPIGATPSVPRTWELALSYALGALAEDPEHRTFDQ